MYMVAHPAAHLYATLITSISVYLSLYILF